MSTAYTDHFKKKWNFGVGINHYNNSVDRKYLSILQNLQSTGKSSNAVQAGKDKFYFFFSLLKHTTWLACHWGY